MKELLAYVLVTQGRESKPNRRVMRIKDEKKLRFWKAMEKNQDRFTFDRVEVREV